MPEKIFFGAGDEMTIADSGILGLSFVDEKSASNSVFLQAVKQQVFKQPIFTTFLQKCNLKEPMCKNGGFLTFGDFDTTHCKPVHKWLPLLNGSNAWQLKLDGFKIDEDQKVDYPVTVSFNFNDYLNKLNIRKNLLDQEIYCKNF